MTIKREIRPRKVGRDGRHEALFHEVRWKRDFRPGADPITDEDIEQLGEIMGRSGLEPTCRRYEQTAREILEAAGERADLDMREMLEIDTGEPWDGKQRVDVATRGHVIRQRHGSFSQEAQAVAIIEAVQSLREHLAADNARGAASAALRLQRAADLIWELSLEVPAAIGLKSIRGGREGAKQRRRVTPADVSRWRTRAEELWTQHPAWRRSKARAAETIAHEEWGDAGHRSFTARTIRRHL